VDVKYWDNTLSILTYSKWNIFRNSIKIARGIVDFIKVSKRTEEKV
jgi:hypothetical protein